MEKDGSADTTSRKHKQMKHARGFASLWNVTIPLYPIVMAKALYNIRVLADGALRKTRFDAFLDGYAPSIDAFPHISQQTYRRGADALWGDFVRVARDTDRTLKQHSSRLIEKNERPKS